MTRAEPAAMSAQLRALVEAVRGAARQVLGPEEGRGERVRVLGVEAATRRKPDGTPVSAVDEALQAALEERLARAWPDTPFLGEEMSEGAQHRIAAYPPFWCADPLDGTTNFTSGFPFLALSVARVDGGGPHLAVVLDPIRDEAFAAERGGGAWLGEARLPLGRGASEGSDVQDEQAGCAHGDDAEVREADRPHAEGPDAESVHGPAPPRALGEAVALIDPKRLHGAVARALVTASPVRSQRNLGAAALEWAWLAAGRAHLLGHGAHHPWDQAAGRLLLAEAGGAFQLKGPEARAVTRLYPWLGPNGLGPVGVRAAATPHLLGLWAAWLEGAEAAGAVGGGGAVDETGGAMAGSPRRAIRSGSRFEEEIGYARAVVEGPWVFVSGTTGFDYQAMTIDPELEPQLLQCLRNVDGALAEAGASVRDVVRIRYLLPHPDDFPPCWPHLRQWLGPNRPAATMIVAGLADPRMRIEIEVTAHRGGNDAPTGSDS